MKKNEVGNKYGRLLVIKENPLKSKNTKWDCICDCGNKYTVVGLKLRSGHTKSCGCIVKKHGKKGTTEYNAWVSMRQRCRDKNCLNYKNYGARGIKICKKWDEFINFLEDMGKKPTPQHSIDRINTNGNYTPQNCRWATRRQQSNNRRDNHHLTLKGITKTVSEWADDTGLSSNVIFHRLSRGYSTKKALTQPLQVHKKI